MQRYQKMTKNQSAYTHYIGKLYESSKEDITTENRVEKNFIYFGSKLIAIKQRAITAKINPPTTNFLHHDNIGNVIAITDKAHKILDRRSYTPFGSIRHIPYNEQLDINKIPSLIERLKNTTNRSFTGHERIEGTDIIHMNGRVYDTITGRFTSADPYIQAPSNTQSYNRYSYVMNNPVNLTDPSGYWSVWKSVRSAGRWLRENKRMIAAVAAAVAVTFVTAGAGAPAAWAGFFSGFGGTVAAGALAGAASGAIMTGTLKGALQGALWGGITAGVAFGVAEGVSSLTKLDAHGATLLGKTAAQRTAGLYKAIAHGLSRAAISKLRYGTTKGAFMSGFISSGFSVGGGEGSVGAFKMAIVGGTISALGGGKFANGAMGSAFQYLFNDMIYGVSDPLTGSSGGLLDSFYSSIEDGWNSLKSALRLNPDGATSKIMTGLGNGISGMWDKAPYYAKGPLVVAGGIVTLPVMSMTYTYMYMNPNSVSYALDAIEGALPGIPPSSGVGYGVATGAGLAGLFNGMQK